MNRIARIIGVTALFLVIAGLAIGQSTQIPQSQDVSGYFTKTSAPKIIRDVLPEYAISKEGKPCGFVDKGQMSITNARGGSYVPFYAHTYAHFGAHHDLRSVPYSTLPAAIEAVERECK
jgi:hypothetical protein